MSFVLVCFAPSLDRQQATQRCENAAQTEMAYTTRPDCTSGIKSAAMELSLSTPLPPQSVPQARYCLPVRFGGVRSPFCSLLSRKRTISGKIVGRLNTASPLSLESLKLMQNHLKAMQNNVCGICFICVKRIMTKIVNICCKQEGRGKLKKKKKERKKRKDSSGLKRVVVPSKQLESLVICLASHTRKKFHFAITIPCISTESHFMAV